MRKIHVNGNVLEIWRCLMMWGRGFINTVFLYPGYTLDAIETMKGNWKHHCFGLKYVSHRWRCHCHCRKRHLSHIAPSLSGNKHVTTERTVWEVARHYHQAFCYCDHTIISQQIYVFNPLEIILVRDSRIESVFFNSFIHTLICSPF